MEALSNTPSDSQQKHVSVAKIMIRFDQHLTAFGLQLHRAELLTLQLNIGRKCNQACRHCHVDAAPWRTEALDQEVAGRFIDWIEAHRPAVVDITGGAPELNLFFKDLVRAARKSGARVIDRNNLTILHEPGFADLPAFLAQHEVEIIASLPCYLEANVSKQRGAGVFRKSIESLQRLNAVGYGTTLPLHLVYNPIGATLPPLQAELEADYKEALQRDHGVVFNQLYTITNQPIARFASDLREQGRWNEYIELLVNSFNPETVEGLMCRTTLNVGYTGKIYDCDFNQMLDMELPAADGATPLYLWDVAPASMVGRSIRTGVHCFACTAGAGSSCTGVVA